MQPFMRQRRRDLLIVGGKDGHRFRAAQLQ
jgi:hypothetical protein